jgi:U11/U12 small nuclear ribonucleoprotein SNRNP25
MDKDQGATERKGKLAKEFDELMKVIEPLDRSLQEELLLLLVRDENLSDLPQNLTSEYVDNLIKIEIGRAFNIYIVKFTGEKIPVVVSPDSTVADIKRSFQVIISAQEEKNLAARKISWKYVWKTWCLTFNGTRLRDDKATVAELNITKDSELRFAKIRRER